MMQKIVVLIMTISLTTALSKEHPNQKLLINKWKMVRTTQEGKEMKPKHEKLVIQFLKKSNQYIVTAVLEETHKGTWTLNDTGDKVTLIDSDTKKEKVIDIIKIDKLHLNISHFDSDVDNTIIEAIPLGKEKSIHLSHKEHMIAKIWHVYESDKEQNVGLMMEFKANKSFIMIPSGMKVPIASGNWHLSDDKKKIIVDMRAENKKMELTIVKIESHDLVLKLEESGLTNKFHDRRIENQKK